MYLITRLMGLPLIRVITCVVLLLTGAYRDYACVGCEAYTVDKNS